MVATIFVLLEFINFSYLILTIRSAHLRPACNCQGQTRLCCLHSFSLSGWYDEIPHGHKYLLYELQSPANLLKKSRHQLKRKYECNHRHSELSHQPNSPISESVSYTHLRAHETVLDLVCRLLLEKKKKSTG